MDYNEVVRLINNKLENSNFERFEESQVIDELNNVLRDVANKTKVFQSMEYVPVSEEQWFKLPKQYVDINRIVYRGDIVDVMSQEKMDSEIPGWERHYTSNGSIINIIYNNFDRHKITYYPRVKAYEPLSLLEIDELLYVGELNKSIGLKYVFRNDLQHIYLSYSRKPKSTDLKEACTIYGSFIPERLVKTDTENNLSDDVLLDEAYINTLIYGTAGYLLIQPGRTEDLGRAQQYLKVYGIDETEIGSIRTDLFTNTVSINREGDYMSPYRK